MKISSGILVMATVILSGCASPRVLHDDAAKTNLIESGMSAQQVMQILGTPTSSNIRADGFRCMEYTLLSHSTNFRHGFPETHFVMLYQGKVVGAGKAPCRLEMMDMNFGPKTAYSSGGKYGAMIKPEK